MPNFNVWCSLDERGPLRTNEPNWSGKDVSPAQAAIKAAKAFTREDPDLTPLYCRVETAPADDKPVTHKYKVEAEPTIQWTTERCD